MDNLEEGFYWIKIKFHSQLNSFGQTIEYDPEETVAYLRHYHNGWGWEAPGYDGNFEADDHIEILAKVPGWIELKAYWAELKGQEDER